MVAEAEYTSSILRCHGCNGTCPVCKFLDGNYDTDTLLKVIDRLDKKLAHEEQYSEQLMRGLIKEIKLNG